MGPRYGIEIIVKKQYLYNRYFITQTRTKIQVYLFSLNWVQNSESPLGQSTQVKLSGFNFVRHACALRLYTRSTKI